MYYWAAKKFKGCYTGVATPVNRTCLLGIIVILPCCVPLNQRGILLHWKNYLPLQSFGQQICDKVKLEKIQ